MPLVAPIASPLVPAPIPGLVAARDGLAALPSLLGPGRPVAPVTTALAGVRDALVGARPQVVARGGSPWLTGELGRIAGAADTLRDSLTSLAERDGMRTFDPAFANDAPQWSSWFAESREMVERALTATADTPMDPRPTTSRAPG